MAFEHADAPIRTSTPENGSHLAREAAAELNKQAPAGRPAEPTHGTLDFGTSADLYGKSQGGWGEVASEFGKGMVDEVVNHPGRLAASVAMGAAVAAGAALLAPEAAIALGVAGAAYGAYELATHAGGWLKNAFTVANPAGHTEAEVEKARQEIRDVGAGTLDLAAGTAGGIGTAALKGAVGKAATSAVERTAAGGGEKIVAGAGEKTLPTAEQVGEAIQSSANDGGAALKTLQNKFENSNTLANPAPDHIQQTHFSASFDGKEPSGDFMKVVTDGDGNAHYILGDVTNHGVEAARTSVRLHSNLDGVDLAKELKGKTAAEGLSVIDHAGNPEDTMVINHVTLNPKTGELQHAGVGDTQTFVLHPDGKLAEFQNNAGEIGPLVPGDEKIRMRFGEYGSDNNTMQLKPGDTVIMATDGVGEGTMVNADGSMSSTHTTVREDLQKLLSGANSPEEISARLKSIALTGRERTSDDSSFFVIRWNGPGA